MIVECNVIMEGNESVVSGGVTSVLEKIKEEGQLAEFTLDKGSVKLGTTEK